MCGLVAQYAPKGGVNRSDMASALEAIRHRGPDGNGIWINTEQSVGLGHARLAIIGITDGAQPIPNEEETLHAVVNGEFYDFERIRKELIAKGHRFRTQSDSEIVIHLYEEYGVECLKHLRGEFAFVIWDSSRNRLFAARDRFGIKPLVYAFLDGTLSIASEAKALFALGVVPAWDDESFFDAANLQYVLPDRTLFSGINQLRPGHMLLAGAEGVQTRCYWDLDYEQEESSGEPFTDAQERSAIEEFRTKFDEAVRLRMRADIPICAHLSGGLDSAAVVGTMARHAGKPVDCFSVSFSHESYDELDVAQRMAQHAGAILHPVPVSQTQIVQHLADAAYYSEGLAVNGHLTAKYLLHKAIREKGFKVSLTGEGSDEVVAGYAHLRSDLFSAQGRKDLVEAVGSTNSVSKGIMLKHGRSLSLEAVQKRLGYVPAFIEAKGTLGYKLSSVLSKDINERHAGVDCYDRLMQSFDVPGQLSGRHRVNQSLYLWTKTALVNYILRTLGDGTEMAHSVEGRVPFLDHVLFQFVRKLPLSMKINQEREKYVLREAVRGLVSDEIYTRQKHPFVAPPLSTFADSGCDELLQDELRSSDFGALRMFDQRKIVDLLDRLPSMTPADRSATDPVFMTALSALALQKRLGLR